MFLGVFARVDMALAARTQLARVWFRDNDGAESYCDVNLPGSTSPDSALSFLASWRGMVEALSSAACFEVELFIRFTDSTPPSAASGSSVLRHGVFIFGSDPDAMAIVRLPSIAPELLESSGPFAGIAIDLAAPGVADLVAALASGLAGVAPCDPLAVDLGDLAAAYREQL